MHQGFPRKPSSLSRSSKSTVRSGNGPTGNRSRFSYVSSGLSALLRYVPVLEARVDVTFSHVVMDSRFPKPGHGETNRGTNLHSYMIPDSIPETSIAFAKCDPSVPISLFATQAFLLRDNVWPCREACKYHWPYGLC